MKSKLYIKRIIIIAGLMAILLTAGNQFYCSRQVYSCSGQHKIYLNDVEFMNIHIKINDNRGKVSMTMKGTYYQTDGSESKIYRHGKYQYKAFNDKIYDAKLLSVHKFFTDKSPEKLNDIIFGIQVGESRNIRINKIRNGLITIGTEYTWFYTCQLDS